LYFQRLNILYLPRSAPGGKVWSPSVSLQHWPIISYPTSRYRWDHAAKRVVDTTDQRR
jgi:hypothetical protein